MPGESSQRRATACEDGRVLTLYYISWPYLATVELDNPKNAPRASPRREYATNNLTLPF